jgi:predicted ATP-grasp superfamily ATP-dependent carboligase
MCFEIAEAYQSYETAKKEKPTYAKASVGEGGCWGQVSNFLEGPMKFGFLHFFQSVNPSR